MGTIWYEDKIMHFLERKVRMFCCCFIVYMRYVLCSYIACMYSVEFYSCFSRVEKPEVLGPEPNLGPLFYAISLSFLYIALKMAQICLPFHFHWPSPEIEILQTERKAISPMCSLYLNNFMRKSSA
jgi:hypothetical protein